MNWLSPHLLPAYKVVSERTFQWAGEQLSDGKSRNQEELERIGVNTGAGLLVRGLWTLPDGRDWLQGKLGLALVGKGMLSKSLIQFSADGWGCVPSL